MKIKKVIFPIAGLGSRMLPLTKMVSKELLMVSGIPLIYYSIEESLSAGFTDFIFIVRNQFAIIEDYIRLYISLKNKLSIFKGSKIKINKIDFLKQDKLFGMGHAIWRAKDLIGKEPFAIILPDDLIKSKISIMSQMLKKFVKFNSSILAAVDFKNKDSSKYGNLTTTLSKYNRINKILGMLEKPLNINQGSRLVSVGRYIFTSNIFDYIEQDAFKNKDEFFLTSAISNLSKNFEVYGYEFDGSWFDCGKDEGLRMANIAFTLNKLKLTKNC